MSTTSELVERAIRAMADAFPLSWKIATEAQRAYLREVVHKEIEDAAADRLSELEAGDGWMPIETAPKDVAVLIFVHGETQKAVLQQTPLHGPIWFDTNYDMTTWNPTSVTHWRPLPAPPAAQEKK